MPTVNRYPRPRCGTPMVPIEVTTVDDAEPSYVPGCSCLPPDLDAD